MPRVTFDPVKAARTRTERGLDFADAEAIFAGLTYEADDRRRDYGERRVVTVGYLRGRMMVVVWTPRGNARHVISMRKANEREKARYSQRLAEG